MLRLEDLSIIKKKRAKSYDPEKWSLNPFHNIPIPIFPLGEKTNGSDNYLAK